MSLSQIQIIKALAEALQWLEKELAWGAPIQELRHLTGRIGELYTAMITRGQMATAVNQRGYDVVSADGERISVKTVTSASRVDFNRATIDQVDRVVILRINLDEGEPSLEELMDLPIAEVLPQLRDIGTALYFPVSRSPRPPADLSKLKETARAAWQGYLVIQLENGMIIVERDGASVNPAKPVLREIARQHGVDIMNVMGNPKNTRSLGHFLIEVFPALSLPSLDDRFALRMGAPKYNPANRSRFRMQDWRTVVQVVGQIADDLGLTEMVAWVETLGELDTPRKADQDRLDAVICALVGLLWRSGHPEAITMLGDLTSGYMVAPISAATRSRLRDASQRRSVAMT